MATTDPITGASIRDQNDFASGGQQIGALLAALRTLVSAKFNTASARDAAYAAVPGSLTDGTPCTVAGVPQVYRNGQWRGLVSTSVNQLTFFPTTISTDTETGIATVAIPDPGFPYIIDTSFTAVVAAQAGVYVNVRARLDSITGTVISQDVQRSGSLPAGESIPVTSSPFPSGTLTGPRTLVLAGRRTLGSGNWAVPAGGSNLYATIRPSLA